MAASRCGPNWRSFAPALCDSLHVVHTSASIAEGALSAIAEREMRLTAVGASRYVRRHDRHRHRHRDPGRRCAKSFGKVSALRGIDFAVPRGTVLGVLGPNGAGKTTAVRILTTLLLPDGGRAIVDGLRRGPAAGRRAQVHRPGRPVRRHPGGADRPGEPRDHRPAVSTSAGPRRGRGPANCSSGSTWPTRPTGRPRPTPAACSAVSTWPPAWSASRRCCSSTSRRPDSTPASRLGMWEIIRELVARARRCC